MRKGCKRQIRILGDTVTNKELDRSGFMEAFGMGKDLSKMTLEELWALFPIFLVPHDDRWKDSFNEIRQTLTGLLAAQPVVRISHIGTILGELFALRVIVI